MTSSEDLYSFKLQFDDICVKSKKILITSHMGPDDDSIGSVMATYTYLKEGLGLGIPIDIKYTGRKKNRWDNFDMIELIEYVDDVADYFENYDTVVIVDSTSIHQISHNKNAFYSVGTKFLWIDHHEKHSKVSLPGLIYLNSNRQSNVENIYNLFFVDKLNYYPINLLEFLLLGVLGDSVGLKYLKEDHYSLKLVLRLLDINKDLSIEKTQNKLNTSSIDSLHYLGELLNNVENVQLGEWGHAVYTYLHLQNKNIDEFNYAYDFFKPMITTISNIDWGFYVKDGGDIFKVSLRSKNDTIDVGKLASVIFEKGGGHTHAAGGIVSKDTCANERDVVNKILNFVDKHSAKDYLC